MSQSLEALSRRTQSMQGIRSVVHTMKTLSVINAAPYEHAAHAVGAYHATILDGLHAFFAGTTVAMPQPDVGKSVCVVFGTDHGLCGNYNEVLAAHVKAKIGSTPTLILCVGAQMADALADQNLGVEAVFFPPASVDGIGRMANLLTQKLDEIGQGIAPRDIAVALAYSSQGGDTAQTAEFKALLPLSAELIAGFQSTPWVSRSLPQSTMPPAALFRSLLRSHLFASMFRAAADALVTENAARLALMQQAEHTVDDRLAELLSETRSVRQNEITTELLDVIVGFEALKKRNLPRKRDP